MHEALRDLPSIAALLASVKGSELPLWALTMAARDLVARERERRLQGRAPSSISARDVEARAQEHVAPRLRSVINATGIVLHTNLGRAPLAETAADSLARVARGYSNLEFDLASGERGSRHDHVAALLSAVTGAEAAVVVNNNAAALVLALAAMARGRDVIVSRGELIEIGGSFRIPEMLTLTGCGLREVGTTNRTHLRDYEAALPGAGLLLKVHRSNFAMTGFVAEVEPAAMAAAGRRADVPTLVDLGSGVLRDEATQRALGLPAEPSVQATVATGVDAVCFSGDKLLGGPQAGIIVGKRVWITAMAKHPLMRVLRPDKLTIAALEATLQLVRAERWQELPVWRLIDQPLASIQARAERLAALLRDASMNADVRPSEGTVGGGTMPTSVLPSYAVVLSGNARALEAALRAGSPPVIARVAHDALWLDMRCVADGDVGMLAEAVARAYGAMR